MSPAPTSTSNRSSPSTPAKVLLVGDPIRHGAVVQRPRLAGSLTRRDDVEVPSSSSLTTQGGCRLPCGGGAAPSRRAWLTGRYNSEVDASPPAPDGYSPASRSARAHTASASGRTPAAFRSVTPTTCLTTRSSSPPSSSC
jgi:hypothetical protein